MNYWDSSALVESTLNADIRARLLEDGGVTRTHTLAEMFSTLSGGSLPIRVSANEAAQSVKLAAEHLQFVHLSENEIIDALNKAQSRGVRGGRVHDYLHALAAKKAGAATLLTMDQNDFDDLVPGLRVEQV